MCVCLLVCAPPEMIVSEFKKCPPPKWRHTHTIHTQYIYTQGGAHTRTYTHTHTPTLPRTAHQTIPVGAHFEVSLFCNQSYCILLLSFLYPAIPWSTFKTTNPLCVLTPPPTFLPPLPRPPSRPGYAVLRRSSASVLLKFSFWRFAAIKPF